MESRTPIALAAYSPQWRYFCKPATRPRLFHVDAAPIDDPFFAEHLRFRDALRADPPLVADNLALKLELAAGFVDDAQSYADARGPFIRSVFAR